MTTGGSLFLIAVGAILKIAMTAEVAGIGVVLMVIGGLGLVLSLFFSVSSRSQRMADPGPHTLVTAEDS